MMLLPRIPAFLRLRNPIGRMLGRRVIGVLNYEQRRTEGGEIRLLETGEPRALE
jgi:hypothetical protein